MIEVRMRGGKYTVTARCEDMCFNHEEGTATFYYDDMIFTVPVEQLEYISQIEEKQEEGE